MAESQRLEREAELGIVFLESLESLAFTDS
jgi:hypothetical protein